MNRTTLARRYAPLVVLAAVQLFIIAVVPSKTPEAVDPATQQLSAGGPGETQVAIEGVEGFTVDPNTGATIPVAGGGGGGTRVTTPGGGPGGPGVAAGDTRHCVAGRQYDPKIYYYAPPCVPKSDGKNPGATYMGVTDKTIKVVKYEGKPNPAVDAILNSLNLNPTDEDVQTMITAATKLINDKYELYGRKIEIKRVKGQCDTVPPDYVCLRGEMRDLVQREKPFAVLWLTTLASPAFEELSAQHVVNMGGYHFRDSFGVRNRPYHYDELMGGTTVARNVAEWYCNRMHGHKAANAGETGNDPQRHNPPTNDIRNKTRVLGVISTDDPENKNTITEFKAELAKCGAKVEHEYYYAQDIARAEEQRRLGVAKMREAPESTTIMCFCDPVAPVFLFRTCQEQAYFPEHVVVGTAGMDTDVVAQAYDGTLNPGGHQWENAFGLGSQPKEKPLNESAAADIEKYAGMDGKIPASYAAAPSDLAYYLSLAGMIQMAGAQLTPTSLEEGAFKVGRRGGTAEILDPFLNLRRYAPPNDYTAHEDMREIYFTRNKTSHYNGAPGTYVDLNNGRRFTPGQFPKGPIVLPPKATR